MFSPLFKYVRRAWLPETQANNVYVPLTTNIMQTLNGNGWAITGAPPRIVSMPYPINPNARPFNTPWLGNQIPGQVVTQGLVNNKPGQNF